MGKALNERFFSFRFFDVYISIEERVLHPTHLRESVDECF
jgi:hypothetical protein